MVGCSLRHRGEELLGQRGGLAAYVAERKTMGIPLLYPWANRLSAWRCAVAGREIVIDPDATPLRRDANGLPMHGLLSAAAGWRVERHEATADGAVLAARFDFAADDVLMAAFPFAHELVLEATLSGPTLRVATTVHAAGDAPVPIAFGFHPYLRLARGRARGLERGDPGPGAVAPRRRRCCRPASASPCGSRLGGSARGRSTTPTSRRPTEPRSCSRAAGRRIELAFEAGYPYAQVFAPADDAVIAFEPMTAPANALVTAGPELTLLAPGDSYRAAFSITVRERDGSPGSE